jgi:hypothetical protein
LSENDIPTTSIDETKAANLIMVGRLTLMYR